MARVGAVNLICELAINANQVKPVDVLASSRSGHVFTSFHDDESILDPFERSRARPIPFGATCAVRVRDKIMVVCVVVGSENFTTY